MRWDTTYVTSLPLSTLASLIQQETIREGLAPKTKWLADGSIAILAKQEARWYSILVQARPQDVRYNLRQVGNCVHVSVESRLYLWYALVAAGVAAIAPLLGVWAFRGLAPDAPVSPSAVAGSIVWPFVCLLLAFPLTSFLALYLLAVNTAHLWENVRARARSLHAHLEPLDHRLSRTDARQYMFLLYFLVVAIVGIAATPAMKARDALGFGTFIG